MLGQRRGRRAPPLAAPRLRLALYVLLDLFSRFVVAWMVATHENSALAKQRFAAAVSRYDVAPGELVVHQDRGAPMTSHGFAELLGQLGVERSYSRPRVSNDNPFSESHFHTGKYQPDYRDAFAMSWMLARGARTSSASTTTAITTPALISRDPTSSNAIRRDRIERRASPRGTLVSRKTRLPAPQLTT